MDDKNLYIRVGEESSTIPWSNVKKISRKPSMIVIFSDHFHGFLFTNRVLGRDREEFYQFVISKVKEGK